MPNPFKETKSAFSRSVHTITPRTHYEGTLAIASVAFDFAVILAVDIRELPSLGPIESREVLRERVGITIKKEGVLVDLTDDEYFLFFKKIFPFIIEFDSEHPSDFEMVEQTREWLAPDECAILEESKFGCAFTD